VQPGEGQRVQSGLPSRCAGQSLTSSKKSTQLWIMAQSKEVVALSGLLAASTAHDVATPATMPYTPYAAYLTRHGTLRELGTGVRPTLAAQAAASAQSAGGAACTCAGSPLGSFADGDLAVWPLGHLKWTCQPALHSASSKYTICLHRHLWHKKAGT